MPPISCPLNDFKCADNIELPKVETENVVLRQESYTFVFDESLIFEKVKIEYK